ncbi:MAG: tetratricopeptide repeat protein [Actinomycetota bacterium]|nr:tetratricopeptide repeat protein [Actinomycetota bacterium]
MNLLTKNPPTDLAFLLGAGASRRAGLPTAIDLLKELLTTVVPDEELAAQLKEFCWPAYAGHRHAYDYLRFETVIGWVNQLIDPDLEVLAFLDLASDPSPLLLRIAELAIDGATVVSVNFDDLMERAIAAQGGTPRTVDAHGRNPTLGAGDVGVTKLHGSRWEHRGSRRRRSPRALQATLNAIATRNPALTLAGRARRHLADAVTARTLLVIGYSAADDLDVVPALRETRPARVIWVNHSERFRVACAEAGDPVPPSKSRDDLLTAWRETGVDVLLLDGPAEHVLHELGLGCIAAPAPAALPWRHELRQWCRTCVSHGRGLGLAGFLFGAVERYEDKIDALRRSRAPAGRMAELGWVRSRRAYEIGQSYFLLGFPTLPDAQRWAQRARTYAEVDEDPTSEARALALLGRVHAARGAYDRADDCYRRAMEVAGPATAAWAEAAERRANALLFDDRLRESLEFSRQALPVLRRQGLTDSIIDAYQDIGLARRALGDVPRAADAFAAAERHASPFPMDQQRFAAACMLGETLRSMGLYDEARSALRRGIAFAERTPVYQYELATAHHFVGRVELDRGGIDAAVASYRRSLRVLRRAADEHGARATLALTHLHIAEAHLRGGKRAAALQQLRTVEREFDDALRGEPAATLAMLRYVVRPTKAAAAELRRHLEHVRERQATVFVDLCESLVALRAPADVSPKLLAEASRMAARWRRAGRRRAQ